jgi:hypothetical protein
VSDSFGSSIGGTFDALRECSGRTCVRRDGRNTMVEQRRVSRRIHSAAPSTRREELRVDLFRHVLTVQGEKRIHPGAART